MNIVFLIVITSILIIFAVWMYARRAKSKERQQLDQIRKLEAQIENLKSRRLTASGGLGAKDKLKLLDLIALADAIEDDNDLVRIRVSDLKRRMIEFLKEKK